MAATTPRPRSAITLDSMIAGQGVEILRVRDMTRGYGSHFHDQFSIGLIDRGVGGNRYRGVDYTYPSRTIIAMAPGQAHTGYSSGQQPLSYRMIYAPAPSIERITHEAAGRAIAFDPPQPVLFDPALARAMEVFLDRLDTVSDPLDVETGYVEVVTALLLRHGREPVSVPRPGNEPRALARVRALLHERYRERWSLSELAAEAELSRSYLVRLFRRRFGLPPHAYLNQVRLQKARARIAAGQPIAQVAIEVGFADQSHLTRLFRRSFGVTPGRYASASAAARGQ